MAQTAEALKKELKATVSKETSFVATSENGLTVAKGPTELKALQLLKAALASRN